MTSILNDGVNLLTTLADISSEHKERKTENWITSYKDWALPRTDAPASFIFWSSLFALSSALRRQVWIPKKYLGSWECSPHLYIMFVGPPGMRKTTAMMNFAQPLMKQVDTLSDGPTYFTKELLTDRMIKSPDSALYLMVGEFAEIVQKTKPGEMYDFLTSMYDSKDLLEVGTMMRGIERAIRPCLNFFAATTPVWIAENMSAGIIGGGLASRFIFIYEETLRAPRLMFTSLMNDFQESDQANALVEDLIRISKLKGEFSFWDDKESEDLLNEWNLEHSKGRPSDPRMHGYHSRKPMMMLKLAMLHSVATKDELVITQRDLEFGMFALKTTESSLPKVFGGIGKNEFTFDVEAMIGYVAQNGKTEHYEILNMFKSVATPMKLNELIAGCVATRDFKITMEGSKIFYHV